MLHLKQLSLPAVALIALATPSFALDSEVVVKCSVAFSQASPGDPVPLTDLTVGDAVFIRLSVSQDGQPGAYGGTAYTVVPSSSAIETTGGTLPASAMWASGTVELVDCAIDPSQSAFPTDLFKANQRFEGNVEVDITASWLGAWLPNEQIASQGGALYDLTVGGVPVLLGAMIDVQGGGFHGLFLESIEILPQTTTMSVTKVCAAVENSTGLPARLDATGSDSVQANDLTLTCESLPQNSLGIFLVGTERAFVQQPGNSQGNLCIGGRLGRYSRPGEFRKSTSTGTVSIDLNLTDIPSPIGAVSAQAGDTMLFSYWYRDLNPGNTSNFSDTIEITFQP